MIPPNSSTWLLLSLGVVAGWLRSFWQNIYSHTIGWGVRKIRIHLFIEESEHEEAYNWLNLWAEKRIRAKRISDLRLQRSKDTFELIPHYGTYFFRYREHLLLVFNSTKENSPSSPGSDGGPSISFLRPRRSLSITVWGTLNRSIILQILAEAKREFEESHPKQLVYYVNEGSWWSPHILPRRSLDTIYLPVALRDDILQDFQTFFGSADHYRELGIPWRRGYLFYGPPGTGKSSIAQVMSAHFNVPIYYCNLASVRDQADLRSMFQNVIAPSIVLIEDVDCLPIARERSDGNQNPEPKGVTASDLLNCIDGLIATEGRILILTTNHMEKLDSALVRPGRIDRKFLFDYSREPEIEHFHQNAAKVFELPLYEDFRASLPAATTIATAQVHVFSYPIRESKTTPEKARAM